MRIVWTFFYVCAKADLGKDPISVAAQLGNAVKEKERELI